MIVVGPMACIFNARMICRYTGLEMTLFIACRRTQYAQLMRPFLYDLLYIRRTECFRLRREVHTHALKEHTYIYHESVEKRQKEDDKLQQIIFNIKAQYIFVESYKQDNLIRTSRVSSEVAEGM